MRSSGFTLIEMLLVLALLAIIVGIAAPVTWSLAAQNDLNVSSSIIVQSLRRAQTLASSTSHDSAWGVRLVSNQAIIFSGDSFNLRNQDLDEVVSLPIDLTYSGPGEIVFSKFTALPNTPGFITANNNWGQTRSISINAAGLVND